LPAVTDRVLTITIKATTEGNEDDNPITKIASVDIALRPGQINPIDFQYYFLHNNPSPPSAGTTSQTDLSLDLTQPTATTLYNYDTNRDLVDGLRLVRSSETEETDNTKHQDWVSPVQAERAIGIVHRRGTSRSQRALPAAAPGPLPFDREGMQGIILRSLRTVPGRAQSLNRSLVVVVAALSVLTVACASGSSPTAVEPTQSPTPPPTSTVAPAPTYTPPLGQTPRPSPTPAAAPTPILAPTPTPLPPDVTNPETVPPRAAPLEIVARLNSKRDTPFEPLGPREATIAVGHEETFHVLDLDDLEPLRVSATLDFVSANAYYFIEEGHSVRQDEWGRVAQEVEERIIPAIWRLINPAWEPGGGIDSRITVLNTRTPGVAGYYNSTDSFPVEVARLSNERPVVYINIDAVWPGTNDYYAVLAHELQHAAQHQADAFEEVWMQEGAAEYLAQSVGYETGLRPFFLRRPDTQLTAWSNVPGDTARHYGAAHSFVDYLGGRFGSEELALLIASPLSGTEAVDSWLAGQGSGGGFDELFTDWTADTYLRGHTTDRDSAEVRLAARIDGPVERVGVVSQYGTDYVEISPDGERLRLSFEGSMATTLLPSGPFSGRYVWWGNRGDNVDSMLTRGFDLSSVAAATLRFRLWHEIEELFDFAYVEASRDGGVTWDVLEGLHTTDEDPLGQSYGPGYTGTSGDRREATWVEEEIDLSEYAGGPVLVRFEYVTDSGVNTHGLVIDDIAIPEIGFFDDAEASTGWKASGFVRTDGIVDQRFAVQVIALHEEPTVVTIKLDDANSGMLDLDPDVVSVLVVSGMAPVTTIPADYTYSLELVG